MLFGCNLEAALQTSSEVEGALLEGQKSAAALQSVAQASVDAVGGNLMATLRSALGRAPEEEAPPPRTIFTVRPWRQLGKRTADRVALTVCRVCRLLHIGRNHMTVTTPGATWEPVMEAHELRTLGLQLTVRTASGLLSSCYRLHSLVEARRRESTPCACVSLKLPFPPLTCS